MLSLKYWYGCYKNKLYHWTHCQHFQIVLECFFSYVESKLSFIIDEIRTRSSEINIPRIMRRKNCTRGFKREGNYKTVTRTWMWVYRLLSRDRTTHTQLYEGAKRTGRTSSIRGEVSQVGSAKCSRDLFGSTYRMTYYSNLIHLSNTVDVSTGRTDSWRKDFE